MVICEFPREQGRGVSFAHGESSDDEAPPLLNQDDPAFSTDDEEDQLLLATYEVIGEDENVPVPVIPLSEIPAPKVKPPPSPRSPRKNPTPGCRLKTRKHQGVRSRRRVDNERAVFASLVGPDYDPEDAPDGMDIKPETKSHFTSVLGNKDLLERFVSEGEALLEGTSEVKRRQQKCPEVNNKIFDPEDAFLNIGSNLRAAFKKHTAMGMVEGLEDRIRSFFESKPSESLYLTGLSSYERLLAHACSAYNYLHSKSFDTPGGQRELRIENPAPNFNPSDPSLSSYLTIRKSI